MLDQRTVHTIGTLSVASGVAVVILSLPALFLGTADVVSQTATVEEALSVLGQSISATPFVLGTARTTLTLGLLGVGVGCWLLGLGLLLQGQVEG